MSKPVGSWKCPTGVIEGYWDLCFFGQAVQRGEASDLVAYLATKAE
jgi:hypothetical protein